MHDGNKRNVRSVRDNATIAAEAAASYAESVAGLGGGVKTRPSAVKTPAGSVTDVVKIRPSSTVETPAGSVTGGVKIRPSAVKTPAGSVTDVVKIRPSSTVETPAGSVTGVVKIRPSSTGQTPAGGVSDSDLSPLEDDGAAPDGDSDWETADPPGDAASNTAANVRFRANNAPRAVQQVTLVASAPNCAPVTEATGLTASLLQNASAATQISSIPLGINTEKSFSSTVPGDGARKPHRHK